MKIVPVLIFLTLKLVCVEKRWYLSRVEVNVWGFIQCFSNHGHGTSSMHYLEVQILGPDQTVVNQQFVLTRFQVILILVQAGEPPVYTPSVDPTYRYVGLSEGLLVKW